MFLGSSEWSRASCGQGSDLLVFHRKPFVGLADGVVVFLQNQDQDGSSAGLRLRLPSGLPIDVDHSPTQQQQFDPPMGTLYMKTSRISLSRC